MASAAVQPQGDDAELPPPVSRNHVAPVTPAVDFESTARQGNDNDQAVIGAAGGGNDYETVDESGQLVKARFLDFLMEFHEQVETEDEDEEERYVYVYLEQAQRLAKKQLLETSEENSETLNYPFSETIFCDFAHILQHDAELADALLQEFARFEPFLQQACQQLVSDHSQIQKDIWVSIYNLPLLHTIRGLTHDNVGRLVAVRATVTRTSQVMPELLLATFSCGACGLAAKDIPQNGGYTRPTLCRNPRCGNTSEWDLLQQESKFGDWQKLRVQEVSTEIPPGSMPRSFTLACRGEQVELCRAGDTCVFVGSLAVLPEGEQQRSSTGREGVRGLKSYGVRELTYKSCLVVQCVQPSTFQPTKIPWWAMPKQGDTAQQVAMELTEEEREEIRVMKGTPRLYQKMAESIAPQTFGHLEVKRGILLMLLGGVHKTTPEGMKLRGDVNVCIVGDPSTAKSSFLKYVKEFLEDAAVFTSGKASSAAGLTAAVQRDADSGEPTIEAGALMLADQGICCIDEFDKMDIGDQIAIHEAMEQQTISITKAGIQATLNARASILAAANPIYGRYDRTKTLKANVMLSAPILSRFDLLFVVLDECHEPSDRRVAQHVLNVHRRVDESVTPPFTMEQMRNYLRFAKTLHPKVTSESQAVLVDCYRQLRQGDTLGQSRSAYRITVRQLESMIRLSEALAKLHCEDTVQPRHVNEAYRLLKRSIIHVETQDVTFDDDDDDDEGGDDKNLTTHEHDELQTEHHPGEYAGEEPGETESSFSQEERQPAESDVSHGQEQQPMETKPTKKKTQISFEQFESISSAIASHLRRLEETTQETLTWKQVVEWYLEQCEDQIGSSVEELKRMKKLVNLVIRRLINVDHVLIRIGKEPTSRREEQETRIAVHPNHVLS